jgi:hypothetical protein
MWEHALVTQSSLPNAVYAWSSAGSWKHPGGSWDAVLRVLDLLGADDWEVISMHSHGATPVILLRREKRADASQTGS